MNKPMEIRNPFRERNRKRAFDGIVRAYQNRHRDIIRPDGRRHNGNSIATYFWRGYDDSIPAAKWDGCKDMMAYVFYRAGRAIAKAEGRK